MAGTTPILALPYPTGTDRVADGDNAIEALARALDGTAWVTVGAGAGPPFGSGWTGHAAAPVQYRRDGMGAVHMRGVAIFSAGGPAVFALPVGFRPNYPQVFIGSTGTIGSVGTIEVASADGVVRCNMQVSNGGALQFRLDCTFSTVATMA